MREEFIYHELGHCTLKLDHNDSMDSKGCLMSIMYSHVFGGSDCYTKNSSIIWTRLNLIYRGGESFLIVKSDFSQK